MRPWLRRRPSSSSWRKPGSIWTCRRPILPSQREGDSGFRQNDDAPLYCPLLRLWAARRGLVDVVSFTHQPLPRREQLVAHTLEPVFGERELAVALRPFSRHHHVVHVRGFG